MLPDTAHPAFTKATLAMDLDERRIPVRPDGRADVAAVAAAIDDKTVLIAGSAPCFPYGIFDEDRKFKRCFRADCTRQCHRIESRSVNGRVGRGNGPRDC